MEHFVHAVLVRAAEFIRNGWTQKVLARDAKGVPCPPEADYATGRSLKGALWAAALSIARSTEHAQDLYTRAAARVKGVISQGVAVDPLDLWNDAEQRTKDDVIAAIEAAVTGEDLDAVWARYRRQPRPVGRVQPA